MGRKGGWNKTPRAPRFRGGTGTIFCDEAGFTGNNLLDKQQHAFVYAGLAIKPENAQELVAATIKDFRLQGTELKGTRLLKTDAGRAAIMSILNSCIPDARWVVHHKTYALACKMFEYIFEPPLANQNSMYYAAGFHRFISSLLFGFFQGKDAIAEDLFRDFANWARNGGTVALERIFPAGNLLVQIDGNPMQSIATFAMLHRASIEEELRDTHQNPGVPNWILDLTSTSIYSVLCAWGELYDQLDVYVDRSKPLESETDIMHAMVDRTEKARLRLFGKERAYSFNLTALPTFVNSKDHPGVQLADVIASALASAFQARWRDQSTPELDAWVTTARPSILPDCILPDLRHANPQTQEGFVGAMLLRELVQRSLHQEDLFGGIPEFIEYAVESYPEYKAQLDARRADTPQRSG
jgi:hypothetical protein